jgi:hypothetical protein
MRELDVKLAEKQAEGLEWEAGCAIDYAIGSATMFRRPESIFPLGGIIAFSCRLIGAEGAS